MMKLKQLFVCQRKLRNVNQIPLMLKAIADDDYLPPVRIAEFEDGTLHIEDGHHRCLAYWMSGREELEDHEYDLVLKDFQDRNRFGRIPDLIQRLVVELADTSDSKSGAFGREGSTPSEAT